MNIIVRLLLIAALTVPFAACKKEDDAPKVAEKAPLTAPTNEDSAAWKAYVIDVVGRNMEGVTNQPFLYLLPAESSEDFQGSYDRLLDKAKSDISRGILGGNLLAYSSASLSSAKAADMVVAAFDGVKPDKLKGVKLLFIGKPEDSERVKAAVAPSGVNYVFVETK
ncbi:MAG: hypothetical protein J0M09_01625 [Xanthomonadales bacterium]|jgi:hypothetical protein|nr:hypothetical protein [Xanthomonadales bacterium]